MPGSLTGAIEILGMVVRWGLIAALSGLHLGLAWIEPVQSEVEKFEGPVVNVRSLSGAVLLAGLAASLVPGRSRCRAIAFALLFAGAGAGWWYRG